MKPTTNYQSLFAAAWATEVRVNRTRARLPSRVKIICTVLLAGSSLLLTGCSSTANMTASDFAAQVAATVEKNINLDPEVDCGTRALELLVGATTECFITDPETLETFRADVEIISIGDDQQLELDLSVDPEAM